MLFNIALCDDDAKFLEIFHKTIISFFERYEHDTKIDMFSDGEFLIKAVEMKKKMYDLIFLDISMPLVNGFYAAERLRSIEEDFCLIFTTQVKIIDKKVLKLGAFRYIDKDNLENELDDAITAYLERRHLLMSDDEVVVFTCLFYGEKQEVSVNKKDIYYLERVKRRIWMRTNHGDYEMQTYALTTYWNQLGDEHFTIVARKYCVNLSVVELRGDYFIFPDGSTICIGTSDSTKEDVKLRYVKYKSVRKVTL